MDSEVVNVMNELNSTLEKLEDQGDSILVQHAESDIASMLITLREKIEEANSVEEAYNIVSEFERMLDVSV